MTTRRVFVEGLGSVVATTVFGCVPKGEGPLVRFGLVTDCHYAEIPLAHRPMPIGDASYRESVAKLAEAVAVFNREKVDFEIEWLKRELVAAKGDVIVFTHQRLDAEAESRHLMRNADELHAMFEASGKVRAVFTGHQHSGGGSVMNGIVYYSLRGLVLNPGLAENGYAIAALYPGGRIVVTGYRKAKSI